MKLLLDMNLSPRWASYLREHRFSVEHWSDVGRPDAEDQIIMAHARTQSAIVITSDLDFGAMLALSGDAGPSVVQLRASILAPEVLGPRVRECLVRFNQQLEAGALVVLDDRNSKLRLLPIGLED
jgi:predicted nuclease of predicted toxin-antitoxin system